MGITEGFKRGTDIVRSAPLRKSVFFCFIFSDWWWVAQSRHSVNIDEMSEYILESDVFLGLVFFSAKTEFADQILPGCEPLPKTIRAPLSPSWWSCGQILRRPCSPTIISSLWVPIAVFSPLPESALPRKTEKRSWAGITWWFQLHFFLRCLLCSIPGQSHWPSTSWANYFLLMSLIT